MRWKCRFYVSLLILMKEQKPTHKLSFLYSSGSGLRYRLQSRPCSNQSRKARSPISPWSWCGIHLKVRPSRRLLRYISGKYVWMESSLPVFETPDTYWFSVSDFEFDISLTPFNEWKSKWQGKKVLFRTRVRITRVTHMWLFSLSNWAGTSRWQRSWNSRPHIAWSSLYGKTGHLCQHGGTCPTNHCCFDPSRNGPSGLENYSSNFRG